MFAEYFLDVIKCFHVFRVNGNRQAFFKFQFSGKNTFGFSKFRIRVSSKYIITSKIRGHDFTYIMILMKIVKTAAHLNVLFFE